MRRAQSSTTSANASLPAARSSIGRRRQAGSTLKKVYATYWPLTKRMLATPPGLELRLRLRAGQRARLGGLGGALDHGQVGFRRVVGVEETRLPAVEVGLVADVEEQEAGDGRLAIRKLDRLLVVGALDRFRDGIARRGDAEVGVSAELL